MEPSHLGDGQAADLPVLVIDCGTSLDVTQVERLCERLRLALELRRPVCLDTRSLQRLDSVGVFLLEEFIQRARREGIPVHWPQAGRCLDGAASLLALQRTLANSGGSEGSTF